MLELHKLVQLPMLVNTASAPRVHSTKAKHIAKKDLSSPDRWPRCGSLIVLPALVSESGRNPMSPESESVHSKDVT